MKIVLWILGLLVSLLIGVYVITFTSVGNAVLTPMIEEKIQVQTGLDSRLSTFSLSTSDFEVLIDLDPHNSVHVKGTYSLLKQSFNANYDVKLKRLETLEPLTKKPLKGRLFTHGRALGDMAFMNIDGESDVALSTTVYHVELTDLDPTSIIATIKSADLESLLELAGEKQYAAGKLDVDVDFKSIKQHELDGSIILATKEGKLNNSLMSKDFELNIPETKFSMSLDAKLKGDDIDYTYTLNSNLAKIKSSGNVVPEPLKVDATYNLDVKELAVLKPLTNQDIRGPLQLDGTAKGSRENMTLDGTTDIAASTTKFTMDLVEMKPSSLHADIKNLKIEKLLHMLKQPHFGDGLLSADIAMNDLKKGSLKGTVITTIKKGLLDSAYLTKEHGFKTKMPETSFDLVSNTSLDGDMTQTKLNLKSTLISLDIEKANYNIKDKSIDSDFTTTIANLDKLYFITERHLKGGIALNGEVKKKDKDLDLKVHSKVAGGTLDANLLNDALQVDLKKIQTIKALEMLIYPEVFQSYLDGKLLYDLKAKKGTFKGDLSDGRFAQNMMLSMVKQYGQVDLYKQIFKGNVSADINQEKILTSLALASNTSSISTENAQLDSKKKTIDAKIKILANKHPMSITLKGNTSRPAVMVDPGDMLKGEVQKAVGDKLNGLLKNFF